MGKKYTTISIKLRSPKGVMVDGVIVVRDNFILSTFSDKTLAKQIYDYDKAQGEDVAYNEKMNAYMKRYKNKKMKEIVKELKIEMEKAGGKIVKETLG